MLAVDFFHVDCAITLRRVYVWPGRTPVASRKPPWHAKITRGGSRHGAGGSAGGERRGMASIEIKSMDSPDEMQTPTKATASVVHLGTATVKTQ